MPDFCYFAMGGYTTTRIMPGEIMNFKMRRDENYIFEVFVSAGRNIPCPHPLFVVSSCLRLTWKSNNAIL